MGKNYLIEVTPVKPDGQLATIRMSRRGVSNAGVNLDNKEWLPLLETLPTFSLNLMSSGQLQIPTISYGDLEFICSDAYGNEEWSSYDWSNALASCWYGEDGDPFSQYTQVFAGRVSGFNRQEIYASVALLGSEADLQRPALFDEYEGTGGLEGGAGIKGTLKPRAHGFCKTVSPVQIDTVYLVYQVHGYGPIAGIAKVYDFAQELDPAIANVSTYNELIALDLQPGQWATCNTHGLFRLGGSTDKKLTCDVMGALFNGVYTNTVKTITQQLIREVQPTAVFGTFGSFADAEWCFYAKEATSVADIVYRAVYEAGGYLIPDGAGRWQVGDFYSPVNRGQLRSDRSTLPLVISHEEKTSTGPVWKVSVGHSRCWSVHTESEISPTIFDASGLASTEDLEDALEELANVRADITLQLSRLDAMASDGVLDRAEKKYWEQEYARQSADRNKLVVDGSQFDVSAEITAYQGAATYLTDYLNGLVPAWNDGSQDTPIDRVTFKAAWESLYSAKLVLTQKMTGQASEKAIWDKIIGSGKPDDNATVGAPSGTPVGNKTADEVIDAITDANGVLIPSEQLKADIATAEQIAADLQATYGTTVNAAASASAAAQHETNAQTAASIAAQARTDAQAAQSAANAAKDLAVSAKDGAASSAQNSDAARAASDTAKTASEAARDQAQQYASNSSGSAQAAAGSAGTASTKATEAGQSASAAQASAVTAKATVAALLPTDFSDGWTYWGREWSTGTGTPDAEWSLVDTSYGRVARLTNPSGLLRDIANAGRIPVVAGRKLRITVKWRVLDSAGITPEIEMFRIGISGAGGQFNNAVGHGHIPVGSSGWGDNNGFATATYDINTDDFVNVDPRSAYMRVLIRISRPGTYDVLSLHVDDVTSEQAAKSSAEAAATSQSAAAISEGLAGQSASASHQSATNASSSATNAEQQKEAAYQQALSALQFRSDAETFRNQASQSASNASGSASTATEQAGLAATSATQASGSAGAAAGSASTASSKSTEAGQHANSASASANTATTKAGEAAGSASAAAGSASGAASSANSAGQSASAAQSAEVSATTAAQALMPATFQSLKYWTLDYVGGSGDLTGDVRFNAYDHGTLGRILQVDNNPTFSPHIAAKGRIPLVRNQIYRITVFWLLVGQQANDIGVNAAIFAIGDKPDGSQWNGVNKSVSIPGGEAGWGPGSWATHTLDINSDTLLDQGVQWVRPLFRLDSQGVFAVKSVEIRNITGEYNAFNSASAAAGSASTASIKASEAGNSASAANASQTNAATNDQNSYQNRVAAAGHENAAWDHRVGAAAHESAAFTYRNEASQSASNASGSASTASQQAGLASNSANAAGQSAGAAAGSASTASSKASEASQSASAASSSQVSASNAAAGAQEKFAKSFPNFVGPIGKDAYDYAGDDGTGFNWQYGPSASWPQPYLTAQGVGQGGTYNRILFKESVPKTIGRRYRVTGWFYTNATNCHIVYLWLLTNDNNIWDGNAVGRNGDTTPAGCVNNIAVNSPGFNKFGLEFTVGSDWKSLWRPVFEFQTTGGAPNGVWHMTGITIEDITSEKAAADSASAASSSYSNALYESGLALQRAEAASGHANTASIKAGEAAGSASAASGSAAQASSSASAASSSATLAATFSTGGGNILTNTDFSVNTSGWLFSSQNGEIGSRNTAGDSWRIRNEHNIGIAQNNGTSTGYSEWKQEFAVLGGRWYDVSALVAAHRCQVVVYIQWMDSSGAAPFGAPNSGILTTGSGGNNVDGWTPVGFKSQAPSGAVAARIILRKLGTLSGNPDSYAWFSRPQVRETFATAPTPCLYSAGNGGAVATNMSASIATNQTAIATINGSLANLTQVVQSGSPNLLRNGGFALGMNYWSGTHGGWNPHTAGGWGRVTGNGTNFEGYNYIDSERVPIFGSTHYTFSADSAFFINSGGTGHVYLEMIWYDGAGNYITQNSGPSRNATHDFSNDGSSRNALKMTVQAPSNATHVMTRLVAYKSGGVVNTINWRQVKLEQGQNMTVFSNEASVTTMSETVTAVDGKANTALARASTRLDVNGYVTGWEMANNGQSGNMILNVDNLEIRKPGSSGARTEFSGSNMRVYDSNGVLRVRLGVW